MYVNHNLETIEEEFVDDDDDDEEEEEDNEFLASSFCMSAATLASPLATSILIE